jgi:dTDP-4-amino-4,6-dideoxygalactose transaminase
VLSRAERWYSNFGPCNDLLVERVSELLEDRPVVAVSSAGIGLIAALRTLVPSDSRARHVILPSFTFAATAAAVIWCGLEPVFCDVDPDGWHLSPSGLQAALEDRSGTVAAVLACSAFGTPPAAEISAAWSTLADEWGVPLVVDAAAGFGASEWTRPPDAEVFSMHATKPLAVGEGGLVAFADQAQAASARMVVNHGIDADQDAVVVGLNGKLDEWHSATALAALDTLSERVALRQAAAARMRVRLRAHDIDFQARADRSPTQFVPALVPSARRRDEVLARAATLGVELRTYFDPPLHETTAYRGCERSGDLRVTTDLAARMLSLPMADEITLADEDLILECFRT